MKFIKANDHQQAGVEIMSVRRRSRLPWTPERRRLLRDRAMLYLHERAGMSLRDIVEIGIGFKDDPISSTPGILKRIVAARQACAAEAEKIRLRNAEGSGSDPDLWD